MLCCHLKLIYCYSSCVVHFMLFIYIMLLYDSHLYVIHLMLYYYFLIPHIASILRISFLTEERSHSTMRKQSLYDIKNSNAQYDQDRCIYILNDSLMNDPMYYYVTFEFHMNYGNSETSGVEKEFIFHLYFNRAPYGRWHLVWPVVLLKWCTLPLQGKVALNFSYWFFCPLWIFVPSNNAVAVHENSFSKICKFKLQC